MTERFIVKTGFIGPDDYKGARVTLRWGMRRSVVPVYYGWTTDNVNVEAIAETFKIDKDAIQYGGMKGLYIVTVPELPDIRWE